MVTNGLIPIHFDKPMAPILCMGNNSFWAKIDNEGEEEEEENNVNCIHLKSCDR